MVNHLNLQQHIRQWFNRSVRIDGRTRTAAGVDASASAAGAGGADAGRCTLHWHCQRHTLAGVVDLYSAKNDCTIAPTEVDAASSFLSAAVLI